MKKLLVTFILGIFLALPCVAMAQGTPPLAKPPISPDQNVTNQIDTIFKIQTTTKDAAGKDITTQNLQDLKSSVTSKKESTFSDIFSSIIKILTGFAVVMTFVGIVAAGGLFVFSEGEESRTTKARTIIIYTIVGDLIIAASYAIVKGITLIKPLQ